MSARYLTLNITPELAGLEVNTLLRRRLGLSGTVLRRVKWLEDGVTLDGARVNVRVRAQEGQTLAVRLTDPVISSGVAPAPGPLDIVYEDGDLVVLNKAPGVLVHPGHGHFDDTLGNFLMYHYKECGEESDFHPVHRLDKGTSGLVVAAKHPHAQEKLKNQLHSGAFRRVYLAVCDGAPPAPSGVIDAPIGRDPRERKRMAVNERNGKSAVTHFTVLQRFREYTYIECRLETGRTHQIRVHMAFAGHPLLGDAVYCRRKEAFHLEGQTLHAMTLGFMHPADGRYVEVTAPLPAYFEHLLHIL